jgi:DNA-binding GntR family transcriptional regulator
MTLTGGRNEAVFGLSGVAQRLDGQISSARIVAEGLRHEILSGVFPPGERIREGRIARELGLGQPTVREALVRLEHEGLIVRHRNKGCRVITLSERDIDEIFRIRLELEPLAGQLALENWAPWKADKLRTVVKDLRTCAKKRNAEEYCRLDLQFHRALWAVSENQHLQRILTRLVLPLFSFDALRLTRDSQFDFDASFKEHEKIAKALATQDPELAKRTIRQVAEGFWKEALRIKSLPLPPNAAAQGEASRLARPGVKPRRRNSEG